MEQEEIIQTVDSNGTQLCHGDTVSVIKDLKVGGTKLTIKKGTVIKNIRLTDNNDEIEKLTFDKDCIVKFKNEPTKTSKQARIKETKLE